jgi:hypothetical protein
MCFIDNRILRKIALLEKEVTFHHSFLEASIISAVLLHDINMRLMKAYKEVCESYQPVEFLPNTVPPYNGWGSEEVLLSHIQHKTAETR